MEKRYLIIIDDECIVDDQRADIEGELDAAIGEKFDLDSGIGFSIEALD